MKTKPILESDFGRRKRCQKYVRILALVLETHRWQNADTLVQLNYVGYGIGMVPESGPGYH